MAWAVFHPIHTGHGKDRKKEWVRVASMPDFDSHIEAVRALMTGLIPDLEGKSDDFIRIHWARWRSNVKAHKIQRV